MRNGTTHLVTGGGAASFATITGSPGDNAALAAALALKLDKAGGTMTGALAITAGSLNTAAISGSQTWNNAGVTCRGIEYVITDTNSAAGSTALRLLGGAAGTTPLLSVDKNGKVTLAGNLVTSTIDPISNCSIRSYGYDCFVADVNYGLLLSRGNYTVPFANGGMQWLNPGTYAAETHLSQPSTGMLDARAGASPVSIRAYGAYTDSLNYERLILKATAGDCEVATEASGTGTRRNLKLNGANRAAYDAAPSTTVIRDILISHGLMAAS